MKKTAVHSHAYVAHVRSVTSSVGVSSTKGGEERQERDFKIGHHPAKERGAYYTSPPNHPTGPVKMTLSQALGQSTSKKKGAA